VQGGIEVSSDLSPRDGMTVSPEHVTLEPRRVFKLMDFGGPFDFNVHNNNLATAYEGVANRVLTNKGVKPYRPSYSYFRKTLIGFFRLMRKHVVQVHPQELEDYPLQYADARKRRIYTKALYSLRFDPVSVKDSYVDAFVKAEKVNVTLKPNAVPRIISPRNPRYHISLGIYLRQLEPLIFKAINKIFREVVVAKGLNALDRGKLIHSKFRFGKTLAFGIDASRFDLHVSKAALRWEHSVYKLYFQSCGRPVREDLARLLAMQLTTRGYVRCKDGKLKYNTVGGRCSGDINTSLGNTLLMSAMVFVWKQVEGINISFINDGDDGVIFMDESDQHHINSFKLFFKRLGFDMKVEDPVSVVEQVGFCRCRPVFTTLGYKMVRDIDESLSKDALTWKPIEHKSYWNKLRQSMSKCGLALASDIPILCQYYRLMGRGAGRCTTNLPDSGLKRLSEGLTSPSIVHPRTRYSFYLAFGILPDEQRAWEKRLLKYNVSHSMVYSLSKLNKLNFEIE
jgi:hypothetical protein